MQCSTKAPIQHFKNATFQVNYGIISSQSGKALRTACCVLEPVEDIESDKAELQGAVRDVYPPLDLNADKGGEQPMRDRRATERKVGHSLK